MLRLGTLVCVVLALAGCGGSETPTEVVLVTHDSFAISPEVKQAFEDESGLTLRILKAGDAGEIVTRALLTAGNPEGDVLFGVDNTLLSRALEGDEASVAQHGRFELCRDDQGSPFGLHQPPTPM